MFFLHIDSVNVAVSLDLNGASSSLLKDPWSLIKDALPWVALVHMNWDEACALSKQHLPGKRKGTRCCSLLFIVVHCWSSTCFVLFCLLYLSTEFFRPFFICAMYSFLLQVGSERDRWAGIVRELKAGMATLLGNMIVSSGLIAYAGPFDSASRSQLCQQWLQCCRQNGVPVDDTDGR